MLDVLNEDYVRTAEAKGLTQRRRSRRRHVLRNALLPVVDDHRPAGRAAAVRGGPHRDGVRLQRASAAFLFDAITTADYPVLQGFILFIARRLALVNLIVDISYGLIDPRVRVQ